MSLPILSLIIANTIWGAASPIFKWSLEEIPPFTLAFLRFYIAAFIFFIYFRAKIFNVQKKDTLKIILIGLFGVTANISFFFLGLKMSKSINAPVIASAQPLILVIFAAIFLKEKLPTNKIVGLVLGFCGVLLIIIQPIIDKGGISIESVGDVFFVLATLGAVLHTLLAKNLMNDHQKINPFVLTFWMFFVGTISFLPMFIIETSNPNFNFKILFEAKPLIGILFGALLSSLVAYALHTFGLSKIKAAETGIFIYIDPIIAVIIAVPLLHETITWEFILGSVLIFGGIFLAEHRLHYHPVHKLFKKYLG